SANFYRSLAQEANAKGITWLAAAGDSGAADCDVADKATTGLSVDLPGAIPEVTSVGGTEFNEGSGSYYNSSNGANGGSAKSYIPERVWNDSVDDGAVIGGGGGKSQYFKKPSWQTGPGVPNDGARDVPDISFSASADHVGYLVMSKGSMTAVGGTSASAPVFAGMVTLINQAQVSKGLTAGLGNINPMLYSLAQSAPGAFHDTTVGDNKVPCEIGSPDCVGGTTTGYSAGPGYDLASGLGSVDLTNLVAAWTGGTVGGGTGGSGGGSGGGG